ncbi:MAG: ribosome maturation factor RimP [Acidobacteria bacterium]|nr:MAG: ribosome maturation factor RimP [Acidobacteriota bacterium]
MRRTCWVGLVPTFYFGLKTMQREPIAERIDNIAIKAAESNGVEFVHSEILGSKRNMTVRIYIDKPEGVTLDDCSIVSRAIEEVIDADDFIPSPYVLEVSSPGLERPLFSIKDFEKFTGKKAKVKTSGEIDGQANFNGRIVSVEGSEIVFEDKTKGTVRIPFDKVAKANLKVDLSEEFKKKR